MAGTQLSSERCRHALRQQGLVEPSFCPPFLVSKVCNIALDAPAPGSWRQLRREQPNIEQIEIGSPVHGQSFRDLRLGKQMTSTYSQVAQS